jgi:hypothetical protein
MMRKHGVGGCHFADPIKIKDRHEEFSNIWPTRDREDPFLDITSTVTSGDCPW